MPRKRDGFVPIGELTGTLPGVVPRGRAMSAQTRHHFTTLRQVNQLIEASEAEPDLGFMARLLALCSLPRTNPKQRVQYIRRNGPYKLIMQAGGDPARLPFGNLRVCSWRGSVRRRCGRNRASWYSAGRCTSSCNGLAWKIGAGGYNGERTRLKNQMTRLFSCNVQLIYADAGHRVQVQSFIADRAEFWWDVKRPTAPVLWDSTIRLGKNSSMRSSRTRSLSTCTPSKRSNGRRSARSVLLARLPDVALKRPLCLSWKQLYRQFGVDPAKSSENTTVQHFRQDCLRELKKIKAAWPDLQYRTVTGALVISPSPPRIAPSQLRFVE